MSAPVHADYYTAPSITANLLRGIFNAIEQGFIDEGMPLTDAQSAFLAGALTELAA